MTSFQHLSNSRAGAFILLAAAFAIIYNPFTSFPFTFCVVSAFILLFTWLQDGSLQSLRFKKIGGKEVRVILVSYAVLELSMDFIFQPVVNWLFNEPADYSAFQALEGNTPKYLRYLCYMWVSAAFGEELLFRSFAFAQLKKIVGDRPVVIIVVSAIIFCIPHLYQGAAGLAMTFLFGIAFGMLYARFNNIWINIIVHGLIDTLFLTLSYAGMLEFYSFSL